MKRSNLGLLQRKLTAGHLCQNGLDTHSLSGNMLFAICFLLWSVDHLHVLCGEQTMSRQQQLIYQRDMVCLPLKTSSFLLLLGAIGMRHVPSCPALCDHIILACILAACKTELGWTHCYDSRQESWSGCVMRLRAASCCVQQPASHSRAAAPQTSQGHIRRASLHCCLSCGLPRSCIIAALQHALVSKFQ